MNLMAKRCPLPGENPRNCLLFLPLGQKEGGGPSDARNHGIYRYRTDCKEVLLQEIPEEK
jgi:hypothetical protein